ncbi:hypothetical protein [Lactococcus phage 1358]|uniref:Uncharacterized protein n=1 Tax=Lactococcus phage 1358 TaxID=741942 RepID=D3W0D9_9CAUD|nr:hypothetical protein ABG43_gp08 [Lactococcus phage 1358]ADD25705.1 hypothetical protein [Lactococcus phage 1358]
MTQIRFYKENTPHVGYYADAEDVLTIAALERDGFIRDEIIVDDKETVEPKDDAELLDDDKETVEPKDDAELLDDDKETVEPKDDAETVADDEEKPKPRRRRRTVEK